MKAPRGPLSLVDVSLELVGVRMKVNGTAGHHRSGWEGAMSSPDGL